MPNPPIHSSISRPSLSTKGSYSSDSERNASSTALPNIYPAPNRLFKSQIREIEGATNKTKLGQPSSKLRHTNISARSGFSQSLSAGGAFIATPQEDAFIVPSRGPNTSHPRGSSNMLNRGQSRNTMSSGGTRNQRPTPAQKQALSLDQLSASLKARVKNVLQFLEQAQDIPTSTRNKVEQQIEEIRQEFLGTEHNLQVERRKLMQESGQLEEQLHEVEQQLKNVIQDRSRISSERDSLLLKVNELSLRKKTSSERITDVEREFMVRETELLEKIHIQEQQLSGKRALWLASNPASSARRNLMTSNHDPFNSPLASYNTSFGDTIMAAMGSTSLGSPTNMSFSSCLGPNSSRKSYGPPPQIKYPPSGPSHKSFAHRSMNLPTGKALPAPDAYMRKGLLNNNRTYNTEPADDIPLSQALVVHGKEDQLAKEYKAAFTKLFDLIEKWARTYTNQPNAENDRNIGSSNQVLWAYMMNCTYPGDKSSSHAHVVALLNDANSRFWFVMRMAVAYCTKDITSHDAFLGFSPEVDRVLKNVEEELKYRGLANERRQRLIDQQARAIQSIVSSANYQKFRGTQISHHTKRLRDMVGPLLNADCARALAGQELGNIVITAWELAVKMTTSHITFQVYFPETCNKFSAATMTAKNSTTNPLTLQVYQARLKLVITPVITLRDDRGTTIIAKSVLHSKVLVMG